MKITSGENGVKKAENMNLDDSADIKL